ncbi:MAG: YndJ family transporter [Planctomycetia bacterium]|nr:YndJ family transporter [Planctomycetia bacterium]
MNVALLEAAPTKARKLPSPYVSFIVHHAVSTIGLAVWLIALAIFHPSPFDLAWSWLALLLAPLVLVPLGLRLGRDGDSETGLAGALARLALRLQLPTALLLAVSFTLPQGAWAAGLAVPWLVTTACIALAGAARVKRRGFSPPADLAIDAGWMMLVVGGIGTVLSRYGAQPLDFPPVIILLTGIHFHFAGFLLPVLTGLAARRLPGTMADGACLCAIASVPLLAVGITATQLGWGSVLESAAACLTAAGGALVAVQHLRLAGQKDWPPRARVLWAAAGAALAASMALAALYGCRHWLPLAWLDIPWMRALHGTANALGFAALGTWAWTLAERSESAHRSHGSHEI